MDNFMDKLSNRFHAGELIRANGEAEAKQLQNLKEQSEQQTQVLSEVRRLNLKTVEISEQISQMAAMTIERLEQYEEQLERVMEAQAKAEAGPAAPADAESAPQTAPDGTPITAENAIDGGTGWELEMYQGMSQLHTELQNIESLESSLLAFQESQTEQNTKLAALMQQSLEAQLRPNSWQTEVWQSMSLMQQQLQNVEQLAGSQAALQEQMQANQDDIAQSIKDSQEELTKRQFLQEQNLRERIETVIALLQSQESAGGSEELYGMFGEQTVRTEGLLRQQGEQTEALITARSTQTEEMLSQIKELLVGLRVYLDEVEKKTEDFVHKEDVKVYRNVQAVVMETVSSRNRDVMEKLDAADRSITRLKGIKPLVVFSCLFSLASLAAIVLQILGIIG